jgi:queuine tRNA-ribosyltransferase
MILNTIHNIRHYMLLMEKIRAAINENRFGEFKTDYFKQNEMTL